MTEMKFDARKINKIERSGELNLTVIATDEAGNQVYLMGKSAVDTWSVATAVIIQELRIVEQIRERDRLLKENKDLPGSDAPLIEQAELHNNYKRNLVRLMEAGWTPIFPANSEIPDLLKIERQKVYERVQTLLTLAGEEMSGNGEPKAMATLAKMEQALWKLEDAVGGM